MAKIAPSSAYVGVGPCGVSKSQATVVSRPSAGGGTSEPAFISTNDPVP